MALSNITTPLISVDITLNDATVKSLAKSVIPRAGARPSDARVSRFGDVNYPLSDRFGNLRGQTWEVDLIDHDGEWRGRLASGVNRYYKKWEGILYAESNVARLAGTARRKLARGRCITVRTQDQIVTLVFSDELSRHDSPYSLDRECPHVAIGQVYGRGAAATGLTSIEEPPEDLASQPMPILLAEPSDEWRSAADPPTTPIGVHKLRHVGPFLLKGGSETWQGFVVSLYACHSIAAVFGSNLHPECPGSVRLDPDLFSSVLLVPNKGNWSDYFSTPYLDITKNGTLYRTTMVFGRGPIADAHVDGKVPLSANVNGIESEGDASGDLVDDLAYMTQILLHIHLTGTTIGTWQTMPTFPDGTGKMRSTDFLAIKAVHDARLAGRYRGGLILDTKGAARQKLAELLVSANLRLSIDHHGRVGGTTFNAFASLASLTTFTAKDIREGSFKLTSELNAELYENVLAYEAGPEPASGRTTVLKQTITAGTSVTNWGDTYKADDVKFTGIYRPTVAADVSARRLIQTQDGIGRGEFVVDLAGLDLVNGQLIRVTHFEGLGSTGWTNRVLLVNERVLHPNVQDPPQPDDLTVTVTWEDVHDAIVAPPGLVGGGVTSDGLTTSRIGFHPVGTVAGGTAWTVGTVAAGTAWQVG